MQTKQNKLLLHFFPYVLFSQINILPIAGKQPSGTDIWKQIYMLPTNHFNKMLFSLAPCEMWPPVHGVWCPQDWCCHARLTVPLLLKKPPSAKTNNGLEFGECFWAKIMRCGWLPSSSTEQVQLAYSRGREKGWLKTKTRFICKRAGKTSLKGAWWDVRIPTSARKSAATLGLYELWWCFRSLLYDTHPLQADGFNCGDAELLIELCKNSGRKSGTPRSSDNS